MQLTRYGIVLHQLEAQHLELVREWRNADHVRLGMEYQEKITPEKQEGWFKALDGAHNFYFVVYHNESPFGVVNLKNIDWENNTAEAGVFIGNTEYLDSLLCSLAVLVLMEFAFQVLQLEKLIAKIKSDNERVIHFNQKLGYLPIAGEKAPFNYYSVDATRFLAASVGYRQSATKLYGNKLTVLVRKAELPLWKNKVKHISFKDQLVIEVIEA